MAPVPTSASATAAAASSSSPSMSTWMTAGTAAAALVIAGMAAWPAYARAQKTKDVPRPPFKEEQLLRHVFARAAEGNAESVLKVIDSFCWEKMWMMNIGDDKGKVLAAEVRQRQPKVAVEVGGYCGYSAVLIANQLPADGHLYSIEIDPLHAAIATKIIEYAGLASKVTVLVGTAELRLPSLRSTYGVKSIDLLFLDHVKDMYLSDFKRFEASGLIVPGTVVVADNVIYPGAPDYLEYVRGNPKYKNTFYDLHIEYDPSIKDGVEVSVRL